jgi:hypothetical protein
LDYFLNTYDSQDNKQQSLKGRHCNVRVPYKPNTGRDGRCRVLRSEGHETMPRFTGEWFPRRDDPHRFPLYCATILAIFKPWRTLTDLKRNDESFAHAFHNFLTATSATVKRVIENVHYFYECSDKARERRITSDSLAETEWARTEHLDDVDVDEMEEFADDATAACQAITESDIEHAADGVFSSREELYAEVAMNIAEDSNIFAKSQLETSRDTPSPILAAAATHDQLQKCALWSNFLAGYENTDDDEDPSNCVQVDRGRVILHSGDEQIDVNVGYAEAVPDHTPKFQPPTTLNHEQRIAYNIVANHLQTGLPLLMILEGEGGTGKSQLLSIIARMFDDVGAAHKLARTATSGVAACLIGGSTLHSWAGLPPRGMPRSDKWATHPNPDMARRRIHNIKDKLLLIIDEMSMLTLDTLALLSQVITIICAHSN